MVPKHTWSQGVSPGNSTSRNSPGKMVVEVGRECSTMAWCAVELIDTGCWDPELWIVPSPKITWHLAGHTAISLDSLKRAPARTSTSRFSMTRPSKINVWPPRVKGKCVSPTTCRGNEPSVWWTDWELGVTWQPRHWMTV